MNSYLRLGLSLTTCLSAFALNGSTCLAQGYYGGYYDNRAATPAESYARGMADVVRSAGEANLRNSEAAKNYEDARAKYLDNRLKATDTYFQMRSANRQYREAERGERPTADDAARYARSRAPNALSDSQLDPITGRLRWPIALMDDVFQTDRKRLDAMFNYRAKQGYLKTDERQKVNEVIAAMQAELKKRIRDYPSNTYLAARNFLESLRVEASQAVS